MAPKTLLVASAVASLLASCNGSANCNVNDYTYNSASGPTFPTVGAANVLISDSFDNADARNQYVVNNPDALPDVSFVDGRYRAELTNNKGNRTLHYHNAQGRLDAKRLSFPFEYIARNIGIGSLGDSQKAPKPSRSPYIFAGIQVHVLDLESRNSAHFVVGHRGDTTYTVEGKNTVNGCSSVNDAGANIVPDGRADLRVLGNKNGELTWYWQRPNLEWRDGGDNWIPYNGEGKFPGRQANLGDEVYVGLITYAYQQNGVPFVGTADEIQLVNEKAR